MLTNTKCPVCVGARWQSIGERTYRLTELSSLSDYCARRYRVLFEVWFPGESEVRFEWFLCERCGFVLYFPRPSCEDLDSKYRFLMGLGTEQHARAPDHPIEKARAEELYRQAAKYSRRVAKQALDFGGGMAA